MLNTSVLKAQDMLQLTNGTELKVSVIEIRDKTVSYKIFERQDGPIYIINKSEIANIIYQNGQTEVYNRMKTPTETTTPENVVKTPKFGRNIFLIHVSDLFYLNYTMSFERQSADGKFGFQIPVSIGLEQSGDGIGIGTFQNIFYSGLGLKYYPLGQRKVSYFFGPSVKIGVGESFDFSSESDKANFVKIHFNNGLLITPAGGFTLSVIGGIGVRAFDITKNQSYSNYDDLKGFTPSGYLSFMLGYRL